MPAHRLRLVLILAAAASAATATAEPLTAGSGCGGDAFSSAQVIEHRAPRRGPVTAVPDTLCADLSPQHAPSDMRIETYPVIAPQVGSGSGGVPYGGGPRRPLRP